MKSLSWRLSPPIPWIGLLAIVLLFDSSAESFAQTEMAAPPEFLVTTPSGYDFDDTVDLLKGAIEEENLMVVHEIDAQRMLRMVEVQVGGMKQILFFHPRYMKQILEANRNGAIVPPLKIAVMEMKGKVMVQYPKPSYLFETYDGLGDIAADLEALTERIVGNVKK